MPLSLPDEVDLDLIPSPQRRPRLMLAVAAALVAVVGTGVVVTTGSEADTKRLEVHNETAAGAAVPEVPDVAVGDMQSPPTEPDQTVDALIGPPPTFLPRHPKPGSPSTTRPKGKVPTTLPVTLPTYPSPPPGVTIPPVEVPALPHPFGRDPTFASGGLFTKDFTKSFDTVSVVTLQPDGKILVGGDTVTPDGDNDLVVLRLRSDGTPDRSFGVGGYVQHDTGTSEHPDAITVQPDGKILVAGRTGAFHSADRPGGVLRLLPDGAIDSSFADGGVLTTDQAYITGLVLLPDGRFVVAGVEGDPVRQDDISLARYSPTGQPDTSFGTNGRTLVDTGSTSSKSWWDDPRGLVRLDDGALLVVGQRGTAGSPDCLCASALLMRFTSDGTLDTGFNHTGWRTLEFSSFNSASAVLADSGGRVVVGVMVSGDDNRQALIRVRPDGSLDPTFGDHGTTRFAAGNLSALARDPLGRIVAASGRGTFELRRFTGDGAADPTFGGTYRSDVEPYQTEFPTAVVVQPDGRIVYGGYVYRDTSKSTPTGQYDTDWVVERVSLR